MMQNGIFSAEAGVCRGAVPISEYLADAQTRRHQILDFTCEYIWAGDASPRHAHPEDWYAVPRAALKLTTASTWKRPTRAVMTWVAAGLACTHIDAKLSHRLEPRTDVFANLKHGRYQIRLGEIRGHWKRERQQNGHHTSSLRVAPTNGHFG